MTNYKQMIAQLGDGNQLQLSIYNWCFLMTVRTNELIIDPLENQLVSEITKRGMYNSTIQEWLNRRSEDWLILMVKKERL